ncbi:MAG: lyase family protein, partial [Gammaproteobacteria bacterium]|nr:lyase family protein [Gammaproteobacteria bacterium]
MSKKSKQKLWGGRFSEPTDAFVEAFTASVEFDQRMYRQDIEGSRAHAQMLKKSGVLSKSDCELILKGLDQVENEIESGKFEWSVSREDVHMNIEARLT